MASGRLILPIVEPIMLASGEVDTGATLTVYDTGTTNFSDLFAEAALSTPIENPQVSDSAGRFYDQTTVIWTDNSIAYDCVVELSDGSTLIYDDIYVLGAATNTSGFAPINSPHFTGVPTAPTPASNDNSGKLATTAFVAAQAYAPLNSPAFTGTPTAPTATVNTNTTQLATTAFVLAQISGSGTAGYFQSNAITISHGGGGSITHNLGVNPKRVQAVLVCTASINGITTGDEIPVGINTDNSGCLGPQVWCVNDSTTLKYRFGNNGLSVLNTSGNQFDATSSNFNMVVRAWAS